MRLANILSIALLVLGVLGLVWFFGFKRLGKIEDKPTPITEKNYQYKDNVGNTVTTNTVEVVVVPKATITARGRKSSTIAATVVDSKAKTYWIGESMQTMNLDAPLKWVERLILVVDSTARPTRVYMMDEQGQQYDLELGGTAKPMVAKSAS